MGFCWQLDAADASPIFISDTFRQLWVHPGTFKVSSRRKRRALEINRSPEATAQLPAQLQHGRQGCRSGDTEYGGTGTPTLL